MAAPVTTTRNSVARARVVFLFRVLSGEEGLGVSRVGEETERVGLPEGEGLALEPCAGGRAAGRFCGGGFCGTPLGAGLGAPPVRGALGGACPAG
ncbi:hypothetical protein NITGR_550048 [Nitrospina gracilis 3/211]|uniref:Uncharacterized protein n=1 Tax=Nitrospina gracilis (strain 3/211) TaxID=1266370 RepID=M1ZCH2_NITG3|nr:hypothetical protein NITGR_550048 [Nitrospina gracilis 3/211]